MHPILSGFLRGLLSLQPRRAFWGLDGLAPAGTGWRAPVLVIGRAQCRFGRFDVARVPPPKRAAALALQLPGWSPFNDSDYRVAWSEDGHAAVWGWDRAALTAAWQQAHGAGAKLPDCVPEAALRAKPEGDGVVLTRCIDGVEAQQWRGHDLLASRWWPAAPTVADWVAFQRDCGLTVDALDEAMSIREPALSAQPWALLARVGGTGGRLAAKELAAYAALTLALGVPALALAVDQVRLSQARHAAEALLLRETERSQGVTMVRNAALDAADQARALLDLQRYPGPLVHMLAIAQALPETSDAAVREWEMSDGKLSVLMVSTTGEIAGADHVRAFEQTGFFDDVKIITQADARQMAFTMTLKSQAALALPATPASGSAP